MDLMLGSPPDPLRRSSCLYLIHNFDNASCYSHSRDCGDDVLCHSVHASGGARIRRVGVPATKGERIGFLETWSGFELSTPGMDSGPRDTTRATSNSVSRRWICTECTTAFPNIPQPWLRIFVSSTVPRPIYFPLSIRRGMARTSSLGSCGVRTYFVGTCELGECKFRVSCWTRSRSGSVR
jgi:hypothetical protein